MLWRASGFGYSSDSRLSVLLLLRCTALGSRDASTFPIAKISSGMESLWTRQHRNTLAYARAIGGAAVVRETA